MYQTGSRINQDITPKDIIITNLTAGCSLIHLWLSFDAVSALFNRR